MVSLKIRMGLFIIWMKRTWLRTCLRLVSSIHIIYQWQVVLISSVIVFLPDLLIMTVCWLLTRINTDEWMSVDLYLPMLQNGLLRKPLLAMHIVKEWSQSLLWALFTVLVLLLSIRKAICRKVFLLQAMDYLSLLRPIRYVGPIQKKHCMTILVFSWSLYWSH